MLQVSRYVISSKAIARDLERNQSNDGKRFYPGKVTLLILINVVLWVTILAIASGIDLI
jgi:hypothetical protein